MAHIVIVGLNHRSAPVEIREKLAFPADTIGCALRGILEREQISEGVILSTCNRVEVCVLASVAYQGAAIIQDFLSSFHGIPSGELGRYLYHYEGEEAK